MPVQRLSRTMRPRTTPERDRLGRTAARSSPGRATGHHRRASRRRPHGTARTPAVNSAARRCRGDGPQARRARYPSSRRPTPCSGHIAATLNVAWCASISANHSSSSASPRTMPILSRRTRRPSVVPSSPCVTATARAARTRLPSGQRPASGASISQDAEGSLGGRAIAGDAHYLFPSSRRRHAPLDPMPLGRRLARVGMQPQIDRNTAMAALAADLPAAVIAAQFDLAPRAAVTRAQHSRRHSLEYLAAGAEPSSVGAVVDRFRAPSL